MVKNMHVKTRKKWLNVLIPLKTNTHHFAKLQAMCPFHGHNLDVIAQLKIAKRGPTQ